MPDRRAEESPEGWVNWNPNPRVHALARRVRGDAVALCGVTVRVHRGDFEPAASDSCETCSAYVCEGLTVEQARERNTARLAVLVDQPGTIICRRGSRG